MKDMDIKVLTSFEELIGKEITYVYEQEYDKNVIFTKDNCILIFEPQEDDIYFLEQAHLDTFLAREKKTIVDDMISKNVIKTKQVQKYIDEWNRRQEVLKAKTNEREFKEYQRLKAKFENN